MRKALTLVVLIGRRHVQQVRVAVRIIDVAPASIRRFKAHDAALRHILVTFQTNAEISIPMAEFIAAAFGVIIFGGMLSKCSVVTLEIDALSVGFILKDEHAASPGMQAILAELLELPPFQALHLQSRRGCKRGMLEARATR